MRNLVILVFVLGVGGLCAFGFLSLKQGMDKQEIKEELSKIAEGLSLDLSNLDKFRDEIYQTVNNHQNIKLENKDKDIKIYCRALSREEEKKLLKESPLVNLNTSSSLRHATYLIEKTIEVNYVSSWLMLTSQPVSLQAKAYDEVEITIWENAQQKMKAREKAENEKQKKKEKKRKKKRRKKKRRKKKRSE